LTNPIFNDNKLKLGLFCTNATVPQMSKARERYFPTWERSLAVVERADQMGFEAIVSLASYRGPVLDDPQHCSHMDLEPFTWIAAIGARTTYPAVVATFHAPLTTPAFVAKATATIDQITGGRAAINIVAGASQIVFGVFGRQTESPETRYERTAEFVEVLKRFWTEDEEFDFAGRFHRVERGLSVPKPLQKPHPPLINAGVSDRGSDFAAQVADVAFTHIRGEPPDWKATVDRYKERAAGTYGRTLQVWTHGFVVVRDSAEEAQAYLDYYAKQHADRPWVDAWLRELGEGAPELRPEQLVHMQGEWAAGGGFSLVGTPDSVTERLMQLSNAGLDGILLTALEPERMLDQWGREMMPRLEAAGLRMPNAPQN
jgi:FMNH2-dependent dimethyl sulfone monooxygenase